LVSYLVESIIEAVRDQLPLLFFFVCSPLGTICVALLALLSLIVGLSIEQWLVIADIDDQISSSGREDQEVREARGYGGRSIL
jgi:hypothetical protein